MLAPREVMRLPVAQQVQRAWLPLKIYPVSAGVKGGLAGGVAMAVLAMLYGVVFFRSVWYPINLIAGSLYDAPAIPSTQELLRFHVGWFFFALAMHITMCVLVGLLYGAMLPMLPTRPIVLGGIIGPSAVDGIAVPHSGLHQSLAGPANQLDLVCGVAGGLRSSGRAWSWRDRAKFGRRKTYRWPCAPASKRRASSMSATARTPGDEGSLRIWGRHAGRAASAHGLFSERQAGSWSRSSASRTPCWIRWCSIAKTARLAMAPRANMEQP